MDAALRYQHSQGGRGAIAAANLSANALAELAAAQEASKFAQRMIARRNGVRAVRSPHGNFCIGARWLARRVVLGVANSATAESWP
jgi:hypothetical protein